MKPLNLEEFRAVRHDYDRLVAETPNIDPFCSSSYWIIPALEALFPDHRAWIHRTRNSEGYVALARGYHARIGYYLQPMEASWGLAGLLVGTSVPKLVDEFAAHVKKHQGEWDMLFLSGIFEGSAQYQHLLRAFHGQYAVGIGPTMARHLASLEGGFEGWFERRSSKFRSNIRRAREGADEAGLESEYLSDFSEDEVASTLDRIMEVERNSWKAEDNSGIATGPMRNFYERMVPMLAEDGALRVAILSIDGTDVAYCFGGIFESLYRGLQLSYHDEYGDLSPGNLAQIAMLEGLCEEGIETYDMGQAMDYKSRWADEERESLALIVRK